MTPLLISQGVPMILSGDEVARTQHGNNNANCQDHEITWDLTSEQRAMLEWTQQVVRLRDEHGILWRRDFSEAQRPDRVGTPGIGWLRPDGQEMSREQWRDTRVRSLAIYESGAAGDETDDEVRPSPGDSLLLLLNSDDRAVSFHLPTTRGGQKWQFVLDTGRPEQTQATGGTVVAEAVALGHVPWRSSSTGPPRSTRQRSHTGRRARPISKPEPIA